MGEMMPSSDVVDPQHAQLLCDEAVRDNPPARPAIRKVVLEFMAQEAEETGRLLLMRERNHVARAAELRAMKEHHG